MKIFLIFFLSLLISPNSLFSNNDPVVVTEQTIKLGIGAKKELFYGFLEGDEIIFDLKLLKGKNIKEVEITEYPSSSKMFEYKTKNISEKKIKVNKTGIYKFRIKGGGIGKKICRVKILRIPAANKGINFDTSVEWQIGYDSTYITKYSKEIISIDTLIINLSDRTERVHSKTNLDNVNVSRFNVNLPTNKIAKLETSKIISWAYWIGVGNEGQVAYQKEKKKFIKENISNAAAMIDPVAGLALGMYGAISNPPTGDNIKYWITTYYNGVEYRLAQGNSIVATSRVTEMTQGGFTVTLKNDNMINGLNVNVKISAIQVNTKYRQKPYVELKLKKYKYPAMNGAKTE